jgi:hypothetical protein
MDEEARKRFEKMMRGVDSRLKAKVESELIDLRRLYDVMRTEDKEVLTAWIEQVVPVERSPAVGNLQGTLRIELKYRIGPDEYLSVVGLPALAIRKAIEHWDRGELYTPETLGELGLG